MLESIPIAFGLMVLLHVFFSIELTWPGKNVTAQMSIENDCPEFGTVYQQKPLPIFQILVV